MAHEILVSAQGPFLDFRAKGLGPGLDNKGIIDIRFFGVVSVSYQ